MFTIIPLTFHIKEDTKDPSFVSFAKEFRRLDMLKHQLRKKKEKQKGKKRTEREREEPDEKIKNMWIVKPG